MMAVLWWRSAVVAIIVFGLNNRINLVRARQCDLEKIFRTPRDSKLDFDHFEIVERDGYDSTESTTTTTTTEAPPVSDITTKKIGDNIANAQAQVLVRFSGDDIHGSNHIMKIPPQCRNVASHILPQYPSPHYHHPYPPSYPPLYYHPYPPPVPYMFPNYYFCNYGQESQNLPRPLKEYFRRHRQFPEEEEVFIGGRPAAAEESHYPDFVDVIRQSKNLAAKNLANDNQIEPVAAAVIVRPRVLEPLELNNEDVEKAIPINTKASASAKDKKSGKRKNAKMENKNIMDSSEKSKKHHKHGKKDKKDENEELKEWLRKALVAHKVCPNCTEPAKMLVSYPISNLQDCQLDPILSSDSCPSCNKKSDKFLNDMDKLGVFNTGDVRDDCKCLQCQCNKKDKKLNNEMDDLVMIVAEIIDPYDTLLKTSEKDQKSIIYNLAKVGLDLADVDFSDSQQVPPKISLDLELANNKDKCAAGYPSPIKLSPNYNYGYTQPKISHCGYSISSGSRYTSDPYAATYNQAPTNVESIYADDDVMDYRRYNIPGRCYDTRYPFTPYCGAAESYASPSVYHNNYQSRPASSLSNCYFFPEPNVYIKNRPEQLPKCIKVIPRPDLEIAPQNSHICKKCGLKHSGKNFCDNCGHPIAIYPAPRTGYPCPTCP